MGSLSTRMLSKTLMSTEVSQGRMRLVKFCSSTSDNLLVCKRISISMKSCDTVVSQ